MRRLPGVHAPKLWHLPLVRSCRRPASRRHPAQVLLQARRAGHTGLVIKSSTSTRSEFADQRHEQREVDDGKPLAQSPEPDIRDDRYDQPLSWEDFVRAVDQSLYEGDPSRLAVYERGVAGGPSVEYLDQLLELLLAGVPGAIAGAVTAKLVHPKQLIDEIGKARRLQIAEKLRQRNFTGERLLRFLKRYPEWDPKRLPPPI